ncbi:MAG: response regulator [Nitrospirota bacterium]|nr:response regulator [Nitrospirota bacterium]MDH5296524.1 response regulator [Nitrospirota bacterium]MDH5575023.1 response regulator [Nitrospirota bacterium]
MPISQGHILLADNEEIYVEATQDLLQKKGYDCHAVRNAEELGQALDRAWDFDVFITDLNISGKRVLEMVREIPAQSTQLPVIVVTGYPSLPTAVESIRLHVLEYLIKPIDYSVLLAAIKQGLQQKQVLRSVQQARKEAALRMERLAKIEETLKTWGSTISNPEIEEILLTDSKMKESTGQWEGALRVLEKGSPPPNPSPISPHDYFHLREAVFETIQVLQKTKTAFRSKDLADLRKKLESVLAHTKESLKNFSSPTDT